MEFQAPVSGSHRLLRQAFRRLLPRVTETALVGVLMAPGTIHVVGMASESYVAWLQALAVAT
jgi:hypothetical protein